MLAVLTSVYGRHALAAGMLRHLAARVLALAGSVEVRLFAVLSPGDVDVMGDVCRELEVAYAVVANSPLSAKWQIGVDLARTHCGKIRGLMTLGSDDFISAAYLERCVHHLAEGDMIGWGPSTIWALDAETGRLGAWRDAMAFRGARVPAGAGRVYTRDLLDLVDWQLWRVPREHGLDMAAAIRLDRHDIRLESLDPLFDDEMIVDVKLAGNIHSWQSLVFAEVLEPDAAAKRLAIAGLERVLDYVEAKGTA